MKKTSKKLKLENINKEVDNKRFGKGLLESFVRKLTAAGFYVLFVSFERLESPLTHIASLLSVSPASVCYEVPFREKNTEDDSVLSIKEAKFSSNVL